MSSEDRMTTDERLKYLRIMQNRYRQAGCKERRQLLDEMEAVTELHRKSLIRLMNGDLDRQPRRRPRGRAYGPEVDDLEPVGSGANGSPERRRPLSRHCTLPDACRLPSHQEFPYHHLWEWTTMAENQWTHSGALPQFP